MNLTPQHKTILELHSDGAFHCSTEIEFIRDQRKRISELNHGGYIFEALKCTICAPRKHNSQLLMRRLQSKPTRTIHKAIYDPHTGTARMITEVI